MGPADCSPTVGGICCEASPYAIPDYAETPAASCDGSCGGVHDTGGFGGCESCGQGNSYVEGPFEYSQGPGEYVEGPIEYDGPMSPGVQMLPPDSAVTPPQPSKEGVPAPPSGGGGIGTPAPMREPAPVPDRDAGLNRRGVRQMHWVQGLNSPFQPPLVVPRNDANTGSRHSNTRTWTSSGVPTGSTSAVRSAE